MWHLFSSVCFTLLVCVPLATDVFEFIPTKESPAVVCLHLLLLEKCFKRFIFIYMPVYATHSWGCPQKPEECVRAPGVEVIGGCELLRGGAQLGFSEAVSTLNS